MTSNSSMFHCFLLLELYSFFVVKMADMDSLLGSRISLISLQDVRYDGVLYSINQKESSIVLRDGKMFYRWIAIEGCLSLYLYVCNRKTNCELQL